MEIWRGLAYAVQHRNVFPIQVYRAVEHSSIVMRCLPCYQPIEQKTTHAVKLSLGMVMHVWEEGTVKYGCVLHLRGKQVFGFKVSSAAELYAMYVH